MAHQRAEKICEHWRNPLSVAARSHGTAPVWRAVCGGVQRITDSSHEWAREGTIAPSTSTRAPRGGSRFLGPGCAGSRCGHGRGSRCIGLYGLSPRRRRLGRWSPRLGVAGGGHAFLHPILEFLFGAQPEFEVPALRTARLFPNQVGAMADGVHGNRSGRSRYLACCHRLNLFGVSVNSPEVTKRWKAHVSSPGNGCGQAFP